MKLFRKLKTLSRNSVVAIGNFDGLHKGHQYLLSELSKLAKLHNSLVSVISFEPPPLAFFKGKDSVLRILTFRDKCDLLSHYGVDNFFCLKFDKHLAITPPEEFISGLVKHLKPIYFFAGCDFTFGRNGSGNIDLLKELSYKFNFKLKLLENFKLLEKRVSSSWLRVLLQESNLNLVSDLLGRKYQVSGRINKGQSLGVKLGFPTFNVNLNYSSPLQGVFAAKVSFDNNQYQYMAVVNIGNRPTVRVKNYVLEAHLLEQPPCYTVYHMKVVFIKYIRDEHKFNSLADLKSQINKDIILAKQVFKF